MTLEPTTKYNSNKKQKEKKKHLSSNMCYWNIDTNMRNILYTSPAVTSGGCFQSNGLDPQLQFTSVTSTIYLTVHQQRVSGHTHAANLATGYFQITEMNILSGLKRIAANWDCFLAFGLVLCSKAILIKQIQVMLSQKCLSTLAKASWLVSACCSTASSALTTLLTWLFSTNIAFIPLGNGACIK